MLIAIAGLPGAGKSTVSTEVARVSGCALLSVDPIEAALWRAGVGRDQPTGLAAYFVAEDLVQEQLMIGQTALVDAVNDDKLARGQWKDLAERLCVPLVFVEVFCSDPREHQRRLASRRRALKEFPEPTWASVVERRRGFDDWDDDRLRLDSMRPLAENVARVLQYLEKRGA